VTQGALNSYTDPSQHVYWLASRGLGVGALVLISLSVGVGLALSVRISRAPGIAATLKRQHEALALAGLVLIAAHGLTLLGDPYLRPGLAGIALPFAMASQPVWTGVGIIGGWLAAIVGLSFYARRWIGNRTWRRLHRWTLAVYVMSIAHTLGSGSDARSTWLLYLVLVTLAPVALLTLYRTLPPKRRARPRRERGPRALSPEVSP
jgi:sulfoxide reductase heme-binding subunit YedZ